MISERICQQECSVSTLLSATRFGLDGDHAQAEREAILASRFLVFAGFPSSSE